MINSIELKNKVATILPTNHVIVCDVSYSMYQSLPKMRSMLKESLPTLVKDGDTVSIIYFSGGNQCGTIFVGEEINSVNDLSAIHASIDKYLTPIGCTNFNKPLELAFETAKELTSRNGLMNSIVFISDGYHNETGRSDILKTCEKLPLVFSDINFIEYGYYVDRDLFEKMTAATNALHTFAENYDMFVPAFQEIISAGKTAKIEVEIGNADQAVYLDGDRIYTVNADQGIALIPEHISQVWAVGETTIDAVDSITDEQVLYVLLHSAVGSMNPDLAWKVLQKLGDVRLIKAYDNCFTKQDYSNVKDLIAQAVSDPLKRFVDGIDYNMVPDENAKTVIDALNALVKADAMIDIKSEHFSYNRIGRATVQKEDTTIDDLSEQIANATTVEERKELAAKLVQHEEWKPAFTSTQELVPMNKLVNNSSRPNISINTDLKGFVEIPLSAQVEHMLPSQIDTKTYRNYTVVKDGIVNLKSIPVIMPRANLFDVIATGVKVDVYSSIHRDANLDGMASVIVHLESMPLVNRAMTKGISGKEFLTNHVKLQAKKARQKVLKHFREELVGKVNAVALAGQYGVEAAKFLSENGLRDYGFSPKVERAESSDFYMSKELNVKIKTLSSLPAVNAVQKKVDTNKKLNAADHVMYAAIQDYRTAERIYGDDKESLKGYLVEQTKQTINEVRELENALSKVVYGIVLAKSWFCDLDLEDTSMKIEYNNFMFDCSIELEEKKVLI